MASWTTWSSGQPYTPRGVSYGALNLTWCMARPGWFEHPTCGFVVRRSIHLSYGRLIPNHTTCLGFGQAQFGPLPWRHYYCDIIVIFNKWIIPLVFDLRDILEFIQISDYRSSQYRVQEIKWRWDGWEWFPGFPTIHQLIAKFTCAYSSGKMVERVFLKRNKI